MLFEVGKKIHRGGISISPATSAKGLFRTIDPSPGRNM